MNPRTTRWLVVMAVALLAYILVFERSDSRRAAGRTSTRWLEGLERSAIGSLELHWGTNALVRAERAQGVWQLVLPVPYPADGSRIERFLEALDALQERTFIPAREVLAQPRGRGAYGLEPPVGVVIVTAGADRREYRVGQPLAVGTGFYAQRLGSEGVAVVQGALRELWPASPSDWRQHSLVERPAGSWTRLEVRLGASQFELKRNPTNLLWQLSRPAQMRANHLRVENLLQLLQNAEITEFVADGITVGLEPYGLEPPRMEVQLAEGTNVLTSIRFGQSPTNQPGAIYAYLGPLRSVVTVPRPVAEVFQLTPKDLMDPHLVTLDPNELTQIDVQARESFRVVRESTNRWRVIAPREFPADGRLVDELVGRLNQLEVLDVEKEVVTELDFPRYGMAPTNWQYTLWAARTNVLGVVSNVLISQVQFGTQEQDRLLVRRSDEAPVYVTRAETAAQLPQLALQFRERRILQFQTNQVQALTLHAGSRTIRWTRGSGGSWISTGASGAIDMSMGELLLPEVLARLGQLEAQYWAAQGDAQLARLGFTTNTHRLSLDLLVQGQPRNVLLELAGQSPLLAPWGAIQVPDQPERVGFAFSFWFFEPYRELLRALKLPLPGEPEP